MRPVISAVLTELLAILRFDLYLTLDQGSAYTNLSKSKILKHLGEIRHFKIGRSLRIRKSDLDTWLEQFVIEPETYDVSAVVDDIVNRVLEQEGEE